ncbi:CD1871A family CXXC motif-containing protein [Lachnoclostridium sp. Marseille-P6806]|uniref:CD1871A family CXXC motif-containing protein n=1 Tax=Lachnoclostridium sp. Marseille-P6806 TaxID=2364793 RepID=UPI0010315CC9|nr:CD1871A family CXXC motif-containing protein [Lachnoclostridium sp. Marseille-P6806]
MGFAKKCPIRTKYAVQLILILTSVVFVCVGAYRGEAETVFSKAIRLCLECVGIG